MTVRPNLVLGGCNGNYRLMFEEETDWVLRVRVLSRLAAIGMSDAELLPVAASFEELAAQIERAGLT